MKITLHIAFILFCKLASGQFSDSLVLNCYNGKFYDFNFFRKYAVKEVDHYITVFKDNKPQRTFLDYSLRYDKVKNLVTKWVGNELKETYKEGVFGHMIVCSEPDKDTGCTDWQQYNSKGNLIKDYNTRIEYDSLNRIIYFTDTTKDRSHAYTETQLKYSAGKLSNRTDLLYYSSGHPEGKISYDYFYNSSKKFGYRVTYPAHHVKPITKRVYKIKDDHKEFEITDYCEGIILSRETDIVQQ